MAVCATYGKNRLIITSAFWHGIYLTVLSGGSLRIRRDNAPLSLERHGHDSSHFDFFTLDRKNMEHSTSADCK
jgi:hypothetical protein